MAFDIKKFLAEDLKLNEAELAAVLPTMTADRVAAIEANIGLRADLSAGNDSIKKVQGELATANERLNNEMAEWASLSAKEKTEATELRTSLEAARVRATQLETRLTTLAQQHGVDPKPLLDGAVVVPEPKKHVAQDDPDPRYISTTAYAQGLSYAIDLPAALIDIQDQHRELTGERLDTRALTAEIKERAKKGGEVDPFKVWEEKYGIAEKRTVKAKADYDRDMAAAEARGEERVRTQQALPTASTPGRHAPAFGRRDDKGAIQPRTSALNRPAPMSTAMNAAAALASGKYRKTG